MSSSSRGYYHKSGDSGVGSLSDHDSLAANAGGYAGDYGQSSSARRLDQTKLEFERLKAVNTQLEADKQSLKVQNQELKSAMRELQERIKNYKEDNTALSDDLHELRDLNEKLHIENGVLREDVRRLRSSPPRESPPSTSTSSSSGLRRRDSKRSSPSQKEEKERDQRLRDRLDGKTDKGPPSSTSGSSGHSGRTRRPSVIVTMPAVSVPPSSSRSQPLYVPSPSRNSPAMSPSPHVANASTPRTPVNPAYAGYADPSYFDTEQGSGDYVHEPLPHRQAKR